MAQRLALFDLDNTLLGGDSDHEWGNFLIEKGIVDPVAHREQNDAFYRDYDSGLLDIDAYVAFTLAPIMGLDKTGRSELLAQFMEHSVLPMVLQQGLELLSQHREQGDYCVMITATNSFITTPIASHYGVDKLLATDVEETDGQLTGRIAGIPCFQAGKVEKLKQWLDEAALPLGLDDSIFYSDSRNDIPLLELVSEPVAVDPDTKLRQTAEQKGWRIISLRG